MKIYHNTSNSNTREIKSRDLITMCSILHATHVVYINEKTTFFVSDEKNS